jgi:hypothetical protein
MPPAQAAVLAEFNCGFVRVNLADKTAALNIDAPPLDP